MWQNASCPGFLARSRRQSGVRLRHRQPGRARRPSCARSPGQRHRFSPARTNTRARLRDESPRRTRGNQCQGRHASEAALARDRLPQPHIGFIRQDAYDIGKPDPVDPRQPRPIRWVGAQFGAIAGRLRAGLPTLSVGLCRPQCRGGFRLRECRAGKGHHRALSFPARSAISRTLRAAPGAQCGCCLDFCRGRSFRFRPRCQ
ncbi:hypothetical protein D9M72_554860 [compost metagenome]